jgi:hypothetical protein
MTNKRYTTNYRIIYDNDDKMTLEQVVQRLNEQNERIQELEKIKTQFKGQRDYLLWAMERLLPKETFEKQKSYLMDIDEDG